MYEVLEKSAPAAVEAGTSTYRHTALVFLERGAVRHPGRVAVVDERSSYTYGQLFSRARRAGSGLIAGGYCNISLATTGIAGPQSDDSGKPVGLCYLAVGLRDSVYVYKYQFGGSREDITQRAINQSLFLMYKHIK